MKKILIIIVLTFTLTIIYADRDLSGTITSSSVFTPGQYMVMVLRLDFSSIDEETITYIELSLPEGVGMHNSPDAIISGNETLNYSSHNGGIITWGAGEGDTSMGYLSAPDEPIHFSVSLSVYNTVIEDLVVEYQALGSNTGAEPHGFAGEIILSQNQEEDLKCFNLQGDSTPNHNMEENYRVSVINYGPVPVENYTVELLLDGEPILLEQGVEIASGQGEEFNFYWTPGEVGEFSLSGRVNYDYDEHPENNLSNNLDIEVNYWDGIIGDGDEWLYTIPANYYYKNSLTEQIYFTEELWIHGYISSIDFFYNFSEIPEVSELNIWLGETTETDLTNGFIPSSELIQVYSGAIDYQLEGQIAHINLDSPYSYWGGNLVVLVQRPMDTQYYSSSCRFRCSVEPLSPNRTLEKHSDETELDPAVAYIDGDLLDEYANIRFVFVPVESGVIQGFVSSDGDPVSDVLLEIEGTQACTLSDENGIYTFPQTYAGTYNLKASKPGYIDTTMEDVEVQNWETTVADISILPIPPVNVTGYVLGSGNLDMGLEGVTVVLSGIIDYETTTQADGSYSFLEIPANGSYIITASKQGYHDNSLTVVVNETDLVIDDITLWEIAYPVSWLRAGYNEDITEIYLLWDEPFSIDRDLEFYKIYRLLQSEISNPESWELLADEYSETAFTDTTFGDVEQGVYIFAVQAIYSNGNVSNSNFVGPYFEPVFSPTNLEAEAVENNLSLNWQAPNVGEREDRTINKPDNYIETETRDLFAYNVYLDDVLYDSEVTSTNYIFEEVDITVQHQVGVSALYESGFESEIETITYTPVDSEDEMIPEMKNWLGKNYPNPFNPTTTIYFSTEQYEQDEQIDIEIFNIKGQKVKSFLIFSTTSSPITSISWNGTDQSGSPVSSGLYLYKLKVGNKTIDTKKMMLIK